MCVEGGGEVTVNKWTNRQILANVYFANAMQVCRRLQQLEVIKSLIIINYRC